MGSAGSGLLLPHLPPLFGVEFRLDFRVRDCNEAAHKIRELAKVTCRILRGTLRAIRHCDPLETRVVCQSQRRIIRSDPDYSLENAMQFRLTYEGVLYASRTDPRCRADHKQEIRKVFHPQLKRLWEQTPHLGAAIKDGHWKPLPDAFFSQPVPQGYTRAEDLAGRFKCGPYRLVPLVTEELSLVCGIDVLLLRPGKPGNIFASGDIDNRVKTLVDALRIPGPDTNELGKHTPQTGEDPFFCLLQNDSLVNHFSVETDRLLQPIRDVPDDADARVVITVHIRPAEVMFANLSFA